MNRWMAVMSALVLMSALSTADAAGKAVAVMEVENVPGNCEQNVAEIMTTELILALHSSAEYNVGVREHGARARVAKHRGRVESGGGQAEGGRIHSGGKGDDGKSGGESDGISGGADKWDTGNG